MAIYYRRTSSKDGGILPVAVMKVKCKQLFNYFTALFVVQCKQRSVDMHSLLHLTFIT